MKQMLVDSNDFAIVHATVVLARNLGLSVVAEGVEDRETFDKLAEMGCDDAQGYYIARPMAASGFTGWLTTRHSQTEVVAPVDRPIPEPSRLRVV